MKENWKPLTILIIAVLAIQVIFGLMIFLSLGSWQDRGTFGDMFGAVNTLFSGLAFAGVIYAIILQKKELALQRQELEETRGELARTASAQEKSEKALADQVRVAAAAARLTTLNSLKIELEKNINEVVDEQKKNKFTVNLDPSFEPNLLSMLEKYKSRLAEIDQQIQILNDFLEEMS